MSNYGVRGVRLLLGLFLFALGIYLTIQAHIGLAPWEAFTLGVAFHTGMSFGMVSALTGVVLLAADYALGEKIGLGTILNTLLIGIFVDVIQFTGLIPRMDNFPAGVLMLLVGQVCVCLGSYYYIGSALGCGPRDALMVALGKRYPNTPIGLIRGVIEGSVLLIGWLLGAKVGPGTVLSVFGIGFILQATFRLLRFDVKRVEHESLPRTLSRLRG